MEIEVDGEKGCIGPKAHEVMQRLKYHMQNRRVTLSTDHVLLIHGSFENPIVLLT